MSPWRKQTSWKAYYLAMAQAADKAGMSAEAAAYRTAASIAVR